MPVDRVDFADAADEELQLPLVERAEEVGRNQLVESLLERQELLLDPSHEPVGHVQPTGRNESNVPIQFSEISCSHQWIINRSRCSDDPPRPTSRRESYDGGGGLIIELDAESIGHGLGCSNT